MAQVDPLGNALIGNQIYDPNQTSVIGGQVVRLPFVGNKIPVTQLDPTALKIQALLPQPTLPNAVVNNYQVPAYTNFTHTEIPTLKLDHNLSPTIKLSMCYSANRVYSPAANGYTQVFSSVEPTNQLSQTTRLNYDQTLTPTLLMHFGGLVPPLCTLPSAV